MCMTWSTQRKRRCLTWTLTLVRAAGARSVLRRQCFKGPSPIFFQNSRLCYVVSMCLADNHSLSWSTLTTLAELSNSNQTAPWHSPTFGNPPTPLMSSNLSTTPAACVSGCFPQCLSNPSQPRPKNCKICHVKQEAASVRGGCWPCPQGSEGCVRLPVSEPQRYLGLPLPFPLFPWLSDGAAAFTLSSMPSRPTWLLVSADISRPKTPLAELRPIRTFLQNLIYRTIESRALRIPCTERKCYFFKPPVVILLTSGAAGSLRFEPLIIVQMPRPEFSCDTNRKQQEARTRPQRGSCFAGNIWFII